MGTESRAALWLLLLTLATTASPARVARIEIASSSAVLDGRSFGRAGPYERLSGRVYFAVAVDNPHNASIVDLRNAVNLHAGDVEFSADFIAVRPKDLSRGNGTLLLEVPNR